MNEPKKVRIIEENGDLAYSGLLDNGTEILSFPLGGFIFRSEVAKAGRQIVEGWVTPAEMEAERRRRWPELVALRNVVST